MPDKFDVVIAEDPDETEVIVAMERDRLLADPETRARLKIWVTDLLASMNYDPEWPEARQIAACRKLSERDLRTVRLALRMLTHVRRAEMDQDVSRVGGGPRPLPGLRRHRARCHRGIFSSGVYFGPNRPKTRRKPPITVRENRGISAEVALEYKHTDTWSVLMRTSRYRVNEEQRRLVRRLSGIGHDWPTISLIVGVGERTLRRYYGSDYTKGRAESGAAILASMYKAAVRADRPSVEAAKLILDKLGFGPAAPVGKKKQAGIDAMTAEEGTGWAGLLN